MFLTSLFHSRRALLSHYRCRWTTFQKYRSSGGFKATAYSFFPCSL